MKSTPLALCWSGSALAALLVVCSIASGEDQPQWGQLHTRNMISGETGLLDSFDPTTGDGIKWQVDLGYAAWGTPVISQGRVLIGTSKIAGIVPTEFGALTCLDEKDGAQMWRLIVPRRLGDKGYLDQKMIALCSPPTVEGDRVYVVTNRDEIVCLDLNGLADGNDGPYQDEGRYKVQPGEAPQEVTKEDADILWVFDLESQAGVHPHDSPHSSILIDGRYLYVNTSNGVDSSHRVIQKPDAPSLVVLDKETGRLVGQDAEQIGPLIFHCTWSSPALGEVNGRRLIFFCGGDGVVYAFKPLPQQLATDEVQMLEPVWRFDCDPTAPKENVHQYVTNRRMSPSNIMGMPVFYKNRIFVCGGGDVWWGKEEAFVKCIDATRNGDITEDGQVWSYPLEKHACTTPAIYEDLLFVGDLGRNFYCFDANTGELHWKTKMRGEVWSSVLVADGKVFVGSKGRDFCVFKASKNKELISQIRLNDRMHSTPVAANGTLYINTLSRLYAIGK